MSDRRTLANRTNASKSTGPKTEHGKAVAGSNSMRHGIFSDCLFLQDEDPADFDRLQLDLHSAMAAIGTLELSFVERVAVNMWRQRRLVAAETASLALARGEPKIARALSSELCESYIAERLVVERCRWAASGHPTHLLELIVALYNEIAASSSRQHLHLELTFGQAKEGRVIAMDWCEGFIRTVALRKNRADQF